MHNSDDNFAYRQQQASSPQPVNGKICPSIAVIFHHGAEELSIRAEKRALGTAECLKLRSNSILMQDCHANFYCDRISLGIIQDLALLAHPTFSRSDFLF
ncbi:hypothetical protein MD588_12420 [Photobacterium sp. SDRW27]|uniref:hypothetical protein n=1 Tax=Photobacterium obscurum TaxID=2829490 RepID=UPI002243935A|nr:hypothetical protein [Photobacterium obscurum]MCW8329612.1 hypothetical protein [Photobacterium obscurum]